VAVIVKATILWRRAGTDPAQSRLKHFRDDDGGRSRAHKKNAHSFYVPWADLSVANVGGKFRLSHFEVLAICKLVRGSDPGRLVSRSTFMQ